MRLSDPELDLLKSQIAADKGLKKEKYSSRNKNEILR